MMNYLGKRKMSKSDLTPKTHQKRLKGNKKNDLLSKSEILENKSSSKKKRGIKKLMVEDRVISTEELLSRLSNFQYAKKKLISQFSNSSGSSRNISIGPNNQIKKKLKTNDEKNKKMNERKKLKKKVKTNILGNINTLNLRKKNASKEKLYPVVEDLKFPEDIKNKLNKTGYDDEDNNTTESILRKGIEKTFKNLKKAVEDFKASNKRLERARSYRRIRRDNGKERRKGSFRNLEAEISGGEDFDDGYGS